MRSRDGVRSLLLLSRNIFSFYFLDAAFVTAALERCVQPRLQNLACLVLGEEAGR
jgi:hypothetical protein